MDYKTIQKNIGSSPRKVRLVADMVRKMTPEQAIEVLKFTNKAAALPLVKAIKTAMANASVSSPLSFKSIEVNEGLKMRRYRVGTAGRGRGRPYRKRFSQIKIVLTDEAAAQEIKQPSKSDQSQTAAEIIKKEADKGQKDVSKLAGEES